MIKCDYPYLPSLRHLLVRAVLVLLYRQCRLSDFWKVFEKNLNLIILFDNVGSSKYGRYNSNYLAALANLSRESDVSD